MIELLITLFCYVLLLLLIISIAAPPSPPISPNRSSNELEPSQASLFWQQHDAACCSNPRDPLSKLDHAMFLSNERPLHVEWPWMALGILGSAMAWYGMSCNILQRQRAAKASQIIPNWSKVIQIGQPAPIKMRVLPNSKKHSRSFKNIQDHSRILKMYQVLSSIIK